MEELGIHTAIHSQYQVFDASGQLPFSIVFGLCRRPLNDTDVRPIVLRIANSCLDIPYAIAHGLLTLHEHGEERGQETQVHLTGRPRLSESKDGTYLTLSSPVDRAQHWREAMTIYRYHIDPTSELASVLQPGRKYTIRLAGKDLGVKWWAYGDKDQLPGNEGSTTRAPETTKLVNSKSSAGRATFAVVSELPRPPKVETHMRLCRNEESADDADGASTLAISVLNTGAQPITVQTRGHQPLLIPWGPIQPEEIELSRPRIIDAASPAPDSALLIVDAATGDVIRKARKPGCLGLTDSNVDHRPKLETMVTLMAGEPLVRRVDISRLLNGVPDGRYRIEMEPRGVWWCVGSRAKIGDEGDDRVPRQLYNTKIPPLILETEDVVEVRIVNGKIST
ncbi:hypothetical protein F4821DRAFT_234844 [Hypoxylon rubiginosum]|uniref:Uncharacterized protein n=1 Tax=Hypoxylon rubiginosum TaxID=110542 RepID=A0ACC0D6I1_9PEZI|nr:hypothetical protein F4821DRAFT_234844 [Hypoxylon rubiginosum]